MRALWLIIPAVVLAGCDFGLKTCTSNAECAELNATCDTVTGFCVRDPLDGGPTGGGGGMTGGGGGSTGGGSTGGGSTGGGSTGGGSTGGGSTGGGSTGGGSTGGGSTGGGSTGGGTGGGMGGGDGGTGGGAPTGGGGGGVCAPCPTGHECVAGTCTPVALVLVATPPAQPVGLNPQLVTGAILRVDGGAPDNVVLPDLSLVSLMPGVGNLVVVPAFATATTGNAFSFQVRASGEGLSGNTNVDMRLPTDAGVAAGSATLSLDSLPSLVKVELVSHSPVGARGNEWNVPAVALDGTTVSSSTPRRDDSVVLRVSSTSRFSVPKPRLFAGAVEATPISSCPVSCMTNGCECYVLDLWRVPFNQVAGVVPLRTAGFNAQGIGFDGGVAVDGGSPGIPLTRVRWLVRPSGDALRATPAIDLNGNLFFGSMRNASAGDLFALTANGTSPAGWSASGVSVGSVTSVALEPDAGLVYFTANSMSFGPYVSAVTRVGVAPSLGSSGAPRCAASSSQRAFTALALGDFSNPSGLSAITSFGAAGVSNFGFCTWDPSRSSNTLQQKEANDIGPSSPDDSTGVSNLFVNRSGSTNFVTYAAHFSGTDAGVYVVRRDPTANAFEFLGDAKVLLGSSGKNNGVVPATLADTGSGMRLAMSTGPQAAGVFKTSLLSAGPPLLSGASTGKAVTDDAESLWLWGNGDLHQLPPDGGVTAILGSVGSSFPATIGSPVLTARITSDGGLTSDQLFAVSSSGSLAVVPRRNLPASVQFQLPVSSVSASPAFDCNRLAPPDAGAETGILYIVSGNGDVLSLIVDSPRLDRTAKWPKFQKDQFNSGNTSLNLDDGCR